jgi:chromate transport protein ChrA
MVEFLNRQRTLMSAVYPILAVLVLHQLSDLLISITPMRLDDVTWRYGATGLLIGATPTIAIGLGLMLLVSALLDNRTAARWLGIVAMVVAVVIAFAILSFGLDALQVRRMIREDAKPGFDDAGLKSMVLAILFVPTLLYTGWQGFRFAKGAGEKRVDNSPPIVIGG